jgi:nitrite reductase/ring-hydroxylating ferredoxin subunit
MNAPCTQHHSLNAPENLGDPTTFQRLLDEETVPVPEFLRPAPPAGLGDADMAVSRYFSADFHKQEMDKMWPRVWQFVARDEAIPDAGDHVVHDIGDHSVIVMRGDDGVVRAFANSCLHRGIALRPTGGNVEQLRCPFHGFTWDLAGAMKSLPCAWDFKHFGRDRQDLPQVRVETWAGFIFINFDKNAAPLVDWLGVLPEHCADYGLERATTIVHVRKRIPCNWKLAQEAFFESFHVRATHPHILTFTDDVDSQYDLYGDNLARCITPMSIASPNLDGVTQTEVMHDCIAASGRMADGDGDAHTLPPGMTARQYVGEMNRAAYAAASGVDLSHATLAELQDAILYSVFPHFQIWAGYFGNIVYRAMPDGHNPESCIYDVMVLGRHKAHEPRPAAVPVHWLSDDEPFSSAPELGALGPVLDQDMRNLPHMTRGLKASMTGVVTLASYQELRIRAHHHTLDKYLAD